MSRTCTGKVSGYESRLGLQGGAVVPVAQHVPSTGQTRGSVPGTATDPSNTSHGPIQKGLEASAAARALAGHPAGSLQPQHQRGPLAPAKNEP